MSDPYDIYNIETEESDSSKRYKGLAKNKLLFAIGSLVVLIIVSFIYLCNGPVSINVGDVLKYVFTFDRTGDGRIVWDVRMVRLLGAILLGAALAVAGVVMQCILRNPLASPYTLGISNAAAFGAAFAIVFLGGGTMAVAGIHVDNPFVVTLCAFVFAMVATGSILILTKYTKVSAETMVLSGIAISAIFAAALSLTQYFASDSQLGNIISWMFGDVGRATWSWDLFLFAALLIVATYAMFKRWDYNAIDSGEEVAKGLGVDVSKERIIGMILVSVLCAIAVSFFGVIAFVGLLAPHIARMLIGADHRYLIPVSIILGAIILVVSDFIGKTIIDPSVIPVGIITSLLGGPLFIYLLIRRYRQ